MVTAMTLVQARMASVTAHPQRNSDQASWGRSFCQSLGASGGRLTGQRGRARGGESKRPRQEEGVGQCHHGE